LSGIFSALTGAPFSVITGYDQTGIYDLPIRRPDLVAGCRPDPILGKVNDWFNTACFAAPPNGAPGNLDPGNSNPPIPGGSVQYL
jgi:hypothetical protein